VRLVGIQLVQKALHGRTHLVEGGPANNGRPLFFDGGHPVAGVGHHTASACGQADEFGAPVARIGLALEIVELLEVVDQLRCGGEAQLRAGGEFGEPDPTHADGTEDLQVRVADVAVARGGGRSGEFVSEFAEQPNKQLADSEPISGQIP